MKEQIEVINYYELKPDPVRGVHILDTRTGKMWYFIGGYGDFSRRITQAGCAKVVTALGNTRVTEDSILDVLDGLDPVEERVMPIAGIRGEPLRDNKDDTISALRAELATATEAIKERDHWLNEASAALEQYMARYGPLSELRKEN